MKLVGSGGQQARHFLYDASDAIDVGGTAQLLLAERISCSHLLIQNLSAGPLYLEFGSARATATLTSGAVSSCTVTNAGFNFTIAPRIEFMGGGNDFGGGGVAGMGANRTYLGLNQPNGSSPSRPAKGRAVMTGSAGNLSLSSITIDDGGANYAIAPYVFIFNDRNDPYGCAVPAANIEGSILLPAQSAPLIYNGSVCPTDPIAIIGATTGQAFTCRWMD
jgi:hypothetical protein